MSLLMNAALYLGIAFSPADKSAVQDYGAHMSSFEPPRLELRFSTAEEFRRKGVLDLLVEKYNAKHRKTYRAESLALLEEKIMEIDASPYERGDKELHD